MAKFGNSGVSSLISAANAAASRAATYNDQAAAFQFDMSAKTQDDYATYKKYLDGRVAATQNVDPTKALSLTRTGVTANRSFNSAEINRATTSVKFGNESSRDKYSTLSNLQQQATANGDDNLAQSLWGQMASLSVQIQNEDTAAANAATAAGNKADAASKKGYTDAIAKQETGIKQLNAAKLSGEITPTEYNNQMAQFYQGNGQTPGILALTSELAKQEAANGDPNGTYNQKMAAYAASPDTQKFVNGTMDAKTGIDNSQVRVKDANGNYTFASRSASEVTGTSTVTGADGKPVLGQDGLPVTVNHYANPQAFTDKSGAINGFQFATAINPATGKLAPGTGTQNGVLNAIQKPDIHYDDPSGVGYFYTTDKTGNAVKKFIGFEPKTDANGKTYNQAVMGNAPTDITGLPGVQYGIDSKSVGKADTSSGTSSPGGQNLTPSAALKPAGGGVMAGLISKLIGRNNAASQARQDAINLAAAQKQAQARQASEAIAAQQQAAAQAKLLPVFRAPAPAPAPKPTSQYQLPALPTPVPLPGGSGVSTPASTGNYQQDVLNLGRSLGGF